MALPQDDIPDTPAQRARDRGRVLRAFNLSLATVLVLTVVFFAQSGFDFRAFTVMPHDPAGLVGVLTAPLLHGDLKHLAMNCIAILMLGTLAGSVYPRATIRALPIMWLTSGLVAWLLGGPGEHHLGASGVTHGLGFLVFTLGLLRRDRAAIAAGMLAFLFYGGVILTVLPQEAGISWQSHLGGALGGALSGWLFRNADPTPPRRKYSWELEEEEAARQALVDDEAEPARPDEVPVLWHRDDRDGRSDQARDGRNVLPFRRDDERRDIDMTSGR